MDGEVVVLERRLVLRLDVVLTALHLIDDALIALGQAVTQFEEHTMSAASTEPSSSGVPPKART